MKPFKVCSAVVALSLVSTAAPTSADTIKNIVHVTMVQEPETSFPDDVAATKRVLDLQDGPTLLVGHSYGGSIITEAGIHPNVVGLVYVAAHAPDVGEDEAALGKKTPSVLAKTEGGV